MDSAKHFRQTFVSILIWEEVIITNWRGYERRILLLSSCCDTGCTGFMDSLWALSQAQITSWLTLLLIYLGCNHYYCIYWVLCSGQVKCTGFTSLVWLCELRLSSADPYDDDKVQVVLGEMCRLLKSGVWERNQTVIGFCFGAALCVPVGRLVSVVVAKGCKSALSNALNSTVTDNCLSHTSCCLCFRLKARQSPMLF